MQAFADTSKLGWMYVKKPDIHIFLCISSFLLKIQYKFYTSNIVAEILKNHNAIFNQSSVLAVYSFITPKMV
jgi:hypothetical protein